MTTYEAEQKAQHILARERKEPTVHYESVPVPPAVIGTLYHLTPPYWDFLRDSRPRRLKQNPEEVDFKSESFYLLAGIYDQLSGQDKSTFNAELAMRVGRTNCFHRKPGEILQAGTAKQCSSELPVIAEFLVRKGSKPMFFQALSEADVSPGLTLMLMQLEDMIAFNFTVLTDEEYGELGRFVHQLELRIGEFLQGPSPKQTVESNTFFHLKKELPQAIKNLKEAIEQARVAHIKRTMPVPKPMRVQQQMPAASLPKPTFLDALPHLHKDLQSYGHYFIEGKRKEAVGAAFGRVENRLNEIRDSSPVASVSSAIGVSVVHKLFASGILDLPYPMLSQGNPRSQEAYREQIRGFLSSGVGWFRNSFSHEPHNLPELSEWEALELLFIASHMLKLIDLSLMRARTRQP